MAGALLGFPRGGGGGGHTLSHPGYLHSPLQMFGPENEVCNYLALEKIHGMLILWIQAFFLLKKLSYKGVHGHPSTPLATPLDCPRNV